MKKLVAFLCAIALLLGFPSAAFAVVGQITPEGNNLLAEIDKREPANANISGIKLIITNGVSHYPSLTLTKLNIIVSETAKENGDLTYDFRAMNETNTPSTPVTFPDGGTLEFDYQLDTSYLPTVAKKRGIDVQYVGVNIPGARIGTADAEGSLVTSDATSAHVTLPIASGGQIPSLQVTFVDNTPPQPPKPDEGNTTKTDPDPATPAPTSSDGGDSSDDFGSYPDIVTGRTVPHIPLVFTGPGADAGATSPKTGQAVPAETAPLALAVAIPLGAIVALAARRKSVSRAAARFE